MRRILSLSALALTAAVSTGCAVVPEPVVVEEPVVVVPPPLPVCYEVAELTRVEVPAETRTVTSISRIENEPYEPIETRLTQEIVVKQAEIFYTRTDPVDGVAREVTNFCDENIEIGGVGPAQDEMIGEPTPVQN